MLMHESELDPAGHRVYPAVHVDLHGEHVEDEEAPNRGEYVPAAQAEQFTVGSLLSPYDPGPQVKYHTSSNAPSSRPQTTTVPRRAVAGLLFGPVVPSNSQLGGLPALVSASTPVHESSAPGPAKFRSSPVS